MKDSLKYTMISTSGDVYTEEGEWGYYDVCLDEMPNGVVIITPSSDNTDVEVLPAYLKFSKLNWDECMWFDVMAGGDDDATDTTIDAHQITEDTITGHLDLTECPENLESCLSSCPGFSIEIFGACTEECASRCIP